jgi:hypothetical protein
MARPPQYERDPDLTRDVTAVKAAVKRLTPEHRAQLIAVASALLPGRWGHVEPGDHQAPATDYARRDRVLVSPRAKAIESSYGEATNRGTLEGS